MSLGALHRRLVEIARDRVRSGELTERGLARRCGISQPHMHNALKDIRVLSTAAADRLLEALNLNVHELMWRYLGEAETSIRAVPVLRNRIGPGTEAVFTDFRGYTPFPASALKTLVEPVAARIAPDLAMPSTLSADDLVLLDQNPAGRENVSGDDYWVVSDTNGLRIRYIRRGGARIYLATDATLKDPAKWQSILLNEGNILDVVRARIVWFGRNLDRVSGSQR